MVVAGICAAIYQQMNWNYCVVPINDEAGKVLLQGLERTQGIRADHVLIQNWDPPQVDFRIHVDRNDVPTITDAMGNSSSGIGAVRTGKSMSTAIVDSSFVFVLLTSDTDGWDSPIKKQVLEIVDEPGIQVFAVVSDRAVE